MKPGFRINNLIVFGLVFSLLLVGIGGLTAAQAASEGQSGGSIGGSSVLTSSDIGSPIGFLPFEAIIPEGSADLKVLEDEKPPFDPAEHQALREKYGYPSDQRSELSAVEQPIIADDPRKEVDPPPANDDRASATAIPPGLPYIDVVNTSGATLEGTEPAWYCGSGVDRTVWYRYTPTVNEFILIDTYGSSFDTVLLVLLDGPETPVGCNDQANGTNQSQLTIEGVSGITYLIGVGGWMGASGNMEINLRELGGFTDCSAVVDVSLPECLALQDLYLTTGGASWTRSSGWLVTNEVCTWEGVYCPAGAVVSLSLYNNNMVGSLTADLSGLSSLLELDLSYNSLSGAFSTVVDNLPSSLLFLILYSNDLTGSVPDLSSLSNLQALLISGNLLSGDLTPVIDGLPSSIEYVNLAYNDFSGQIPVSAASLPSLEEINLTYNQLTGDLAFSMGNLPISLQYAFLGFNDFYGTIPASVSSLVNLIELHLPYNDGLTGTIPVEITGLALTYFEFEGTYLCEPADAGYIAWKGTVSMYVPGYCGTIPPDITIEALYFWPLVPMPGEAFDTIVNIRNIGGELAGTVRLDVYIDWLPGSPSDYGDYDLLTGSLEPGERETLFIPAAGLLEGSHGVAAYADIDDGLAENNESNNHFGPITLKVSDLYFESYFEAGTFDEWTRVNTGNGFLYPCMDAALSGTWGACVERGTNDKRKQLIDETPGAQKAFNVRFGFDPNSLSMEEGERFRFMQVKMGAERPFFIVMKYQGGQYFIQLNTLRDDLTKAKTGWYLLSDAPHVIEVGWEAASAPAADDGEINLFVDYVDLETLSGLDNDTIYVDSYKTGFTSRLVGKSISGIFYLDDLITSRAGFIGDP